MTLGTHPGAAGESPRAPRRGFTLIELAMVLAITAILLTLSVVVYNRMANKARFTQAKTALKHLQKTETIYFAEFDRYTDNTTLLDFDPTKYDYYEVSVTLMDNAMRFVGHATGIGVMDGDLWHVDLEGDPVQDNAAKARF